MPGWRPARNRVRHQRRKDGADSVDRVQDAQPPVAVVDRDGERVGLCVLQGDSDPREEEGGEEDQKRRLPEHERVADALHGGAEHERASCSNPRADVDVGEGGEQPAGEIDEVDEGDLEEGDAVGGLEVRDEDSDGGVWLGQWRGLGIDG